MSKVGKCSGFEDMQHFYFEINLCYRIPPSNRDLTIFGLTPSNKDLAREGGWRGEGVFERVGSLGWVRVVARERMA